MLKIDGHGYSSTILHRILHMAGVTSFFDVAEVALKVVGEIAISDRQINKLISEVGAEMAADRDARTRRYVEQGQVDDAIAELQQWQSQHGPLPEEPDIPETDPRKIVHATIRYLTNNRSRMDYPD